MARDVHSSSGMKQHNPKLARALVDGLAHMTDAELARYMLLVRTIAECARFQLQARAARHNGCNGAARELDLYAQDTLNRYVARSETTIVETETTTVEQVQ